MFFPQRIIIYVIVCCISTSSAANFIVFVIDTGTLWIFTNSWHDICLYQLRFYESVCIGHVCPLTYVPVVLLSY